MDMNSEKIKGLQELIKQMQALMVDGKGDDEMEKGEVTESIEDAMEEVSGGDMAEGCEDGAADPLKEEKRRFMQGIVDRPKTKSLVLRKPKAPVMASVTVEKTIAAPKKAKGKK